MTKGTFTYLNGNVYLSLGVLYLIIVPFDHMLTAIHAGDDAVIVSRRIRIHRDVSKHNRKTNYFNCTNQINLAGVLQPNRYLSSAGRATPRWVHGFHIPRNLGSGPLLSCNFMEHAIFQPQELQTQARCSTPHVISISTMSTKRKPNLIYRSLKRLNRTGEKE